MGGDPKGEEIVEHAVKVKGDTGSEKLKRGGGRRKERLEVS